MTLFWILICVVAVVAELATPTALVSVWIVIGGLVGLFLSILNVPFWIQFVSFAVVSILLMMIVRPMATRYLRGNTVATNADRHIGEIGVVIKPIHPDEWGLVKVQGTEWHAVSVDATNIDANEKVKVIAIEGAKLIVKSISTEKEG